MPTYIVLAKFTKQGIDNVKDTIKRSDAAAAASNKLGITMTDFYWTFGQYDLVATYEAPNDEAMAALALAVGKGGFMHTETLRAFPTEEMKKILARVD